MAKTSFSHPAKVRTRADSCRLCGYSTLTGIGRDVENVVLARAVKWHAEHRILLNGGKTVVFR